LFATYVGVCVGALDGAIVGEADGLGVGLECVVLTCVVTVLPVTGSIVVTIESSVTISYVGD